MSEPPVNDEAAAGSPAAPASTPADRGDLPVTVITARPQTTIGRLTDAWRHRGYYPLLFREIANKKFRTTVFGAWWLVLRPLMTAGIATFVFSFVIDMPSEDLPYVIFYLSGFCLWSFFAVQVSFAPRTLLWMRGLLRKTYIPRVLVPLASFGPAMADLAVTLSLLGLAIAGYALHEGTLYLNVSWTLLMLPVYAAIAMGLALAFSMILSVMAVIARDVVFMTGYFVQMVMFMTPVLYPASLIPPNIRWAVYTFNPLAIVVEGARWSLCGVGEFKPGLTALSAGVTAIVLTLSTLFFCRAERVLEDLL